MTKRICPTCHQEVDGDELFCPRDGTRLLRPSVYEMIAAENDPLVGTRVANRYLVIRKVGEGGMGEVYLAEHEDIEKKVALKILKQEYSSREDVVARFRQEAVSASRIKHPNVVDVFDFGQLDDGRFYLVMEWLEGKDLATLLGESGRLDPQQAISLAVQACKALDAAHRKGVIHRDLKPENIFLMKSDDGETLVKIVDFGIAKLKEPGEENGGGGRRKLTKTGMIFGTPEYMSPEQARGKGVDRRSDVYAMGVILFEMLTGQVPFYGDTFMAVLTAHLTKEPPRVSDVLPEGEVVSEALENAIARALAKDPDDRIESMEALRLALLQTPEGQPLGGMRDSIDSEIPFDLVSSPSQVQIRSDPEAVATGTTQIEVVTEAEPEAPPPRSSRAWLVGAAVVLVAAGAGAGIALWPKGQTGSTTISQSAAGSLSSQRNELVTSDPATVRSAPGSGVSVAPPTVLSMAPHQQRTVKIHIETKPPGAVVSKREGKQLFQVCAKSPCDYPAHPDEKVTFVAKLQGWEGTGAVIAAAPQTLRIVLHPPSSRKGRGTGKAKSKADGKDSESQGLCRYCLPEGDPDCVYVLRACKKSGAKH